MKTLNTLVILGCSTALLSACSTTREQFDFSKKAPDEFAVMTRAPLEMPTSNDLPTPSPGAPRPQESAPEDQAKAALFGKTSTEPTEQTVTQGENILLQKSGANTAEANIRDVVDAETQEAVEKNTSTFNKLLGKVGKKSNAPAEVIDPVAENERLRQNKITTNN